MPWSAKGARGETVTTWYSAEAIKVLKRKLFMSRSTWEKVLFPLRAFIGRKT